MSTVEPSILDVPAICPDWCTAGPEHLEVHYTVDVFHRGPGLEPVVISGHGGDFRLFEAHVLAATNPDGTPERPFIGLTPNADHVESLDMDPEEVRAMIKKFRTHLDALERFVDRVAAPA